MTESALRSGVHPRGSASCVRPRLWCERCGGDFVYDDVHSVRDNPALRSLANIPRFFTDVTAFSALDCRLYRPTLLTTFAVDAGVGGWRPGRSS